MLSTLHVSTGLVDPASPSDTVYKPADTPMIKAAENSYLGRVYLDWSSYPVISSAPDTSEPNHPLTEITFGDARFMYDVSVMHGKEKPPIAGTVLLDGSAPQGEQVVEMRMNSRLQH